MRTSLKLALLQMAMIAALAQSDLELVRELNTQALQLLEKADPSQRPLFAGQARTIFDQRLAALSALIEKDPHQALLAAFSSDLLEQFAESFPELRAKLETHGAWQGRVEASVEDGPGFASSKAIVRIGAGSDRPFLYFGADTLRGFQSGDLLSVRGVRAGERIAVEAVDVKSEAAPVCSTVGAQNINVILVNLKDHPLPAGMNADFMRGLMLGNTGGGQQNTPDWSVDDFWQQNSDGKTWINRSGTGGLTVVGPYNLPRNYDESGSCDSSGLVAAAWSAADGALNYNDYSKTLIVFSGNGKCIWQGMALVGCSQSLCPGDGACNYSYALVQSWAIGDRGSAFEVTAHELGHNLGLGHANSRDFGTEPLGAPGASGTIKEYGGIFSVMGSLSFGFYSAHHAINTLGWLEPATNYLDVSNSGSYSIQAYESRPGGIKALRIHRPTELPFPDDRVLDGDLFLEFRQKRGIYDSNLNEQVYSGALIHYRDSLTGNATHLLDFTPETDYFGDAGLQVGKTWTDPYTGLSIKANSIVNDTLNVTVTYGASSPCTHASPILTISPGNPTVQPGGTVSYEVKLTNNDSWNCPAPGRLDFSTTRPFGWSGTPKDGAHFMDPGFTSTITLTLTPPSRTAVGTYPVSLMVTNAASGLSATAEASCTVATSKPGAPGTPAPSNGARGVPLSPTLSWNGGTGTASYDLYFGTTSAPHFVTNTTVTSYSPGTLATNKKYFWKVVARNGLGTTSSTVWSFTTQVGGTAPAAPTGPVPALNAAGVALTPSLKWNAAARATSYDVYIGTSTSPPLVGSTATASFTPGPLATGVKYYWRIVAKNAAGSTTSALWSFKTRLVPNAPANPSPANGATRVTRAPTLTWKAAAGATSYQVYFGAAASPPVAGNTTGTAYTPTGTLAAGRKYYWRVVAVSGTGKQTSPTWSFTTK